MNRLSLLSRAVAPTIARRGVHAGQVVSPPKRFMSFEVSLCSCWPREIINLSPLQQQLLYWGFLFTLSMAYPTYIL